MQEGADRSRRRPGARPRSCCASRAAPRRARPPAASPPKAWSALYIAPDGKLGAIVEVNCETDFVAKNDDFLRVRARARASSSRATNPADVAALSALHARSGETVEARAPRWCRRSARTCRSAASRACEAKGKLASLRARRRKIGVLVDLAGGDETLGKDLAMHIAAQQAGGAVDGRGAGRVDRARSARSPRRRRPSPASRPTSSRRWSRAACSKFLDGSHAARPAVREGRQADGRAAARRRRGATVNALRAATWSARASRRSRRLRGRSRGDDRSAAAGRAARTPCPRR